jgi:hypothetical protein
MTKAAGASGVSTNAEEYQADINLAPSMCLSSILGLALLARVRDDGGSSSAGGLAIAQWPSGKSLLRVCCASGGQGLAHDPEKWKPVFRKDHAQTKS